MIIASGGRDFLVPANGTLMVVQNMTWNGLQGFQKDPRVREFYVPYHPEYNQGQLAGAGVVGTFGTERGLTFAIVDQAGHSLPQYAPGAAYRMMEQLLGRIGSLDDVSDFTTQTGNFTGITPLLRAELPLRAAMKQKALLWE